MSATIILLRPKSSSHMPPHCSECRRRHSFRWMRPDCRRWRAAFMKTTSGSRTGSSKPNWACNCAIRTIASASRRSWPTKLAPKPGIRHGRPNGTGPVRRKRHMATYNVLTMGAAYGSLLATKLLFGGHKITMVCLPAEIEAFNKDGARVRLPVRGRKEPVELDSRKLPGKLSAAGPADVNPRDYDLVALAMQEPQYRSPGVRELLDAVARSRVPCMSIMNMPPLPYLKRIPDLNHNALHPAYTDPTVWENFDPKCMTLNSPDPQAIRPPDEKVNVLMVTLPTNFKVARFDSDKSTQMLRQMEADIEAARYEPGDGAIQLPVKLKVHDSIFVPLAKWAMLLTGNYRCVTKDGMRTAQEAVHSDLETSRSVYNFVN